MNLVGWLVRLSEVTRGPSLFLLIPFVGPVADLGENVVITSLIGAFPEAIGFGELLPVFSGIKFMGVAATLLLGLGLGGLAAWRKVKAR